MSTSTIPSCAVIPATREHADLAGRASVGADRPKSIAVYDAVLVATDHDEVDYAADRRNTRSSSSIPATSSSAAASRADRIVKA